MIQTAIAAVCVLASVSAAQTKTQNVFLIMPDGLRWQEVCRGAEEALMTKEHKVDDAAGLKKEFWRDTPEERREALMPFVWTVAAKQGQVFGNRDKGSDAHVDNAMWFSYPGYNEVLCGFADPKIDSNRKIPNQNVTVFEWLNGKPAFKGKVAAFTTWDVFPFIFNTERSGLVVDDGIVPLTQGKITPGIELINKLREQTPRRWGGSHFDALMFRAAMEWIGANKPRVVFIGLGETDEWAHEGDYGRYLQAAHRDDGYIRELWEFCQSDPQYKDTTTFIITPDHGRGDNSAGPKDWNNHGAKHPGSNQTWMAILGPDTRALGERGAGTVVSISQVAATIAAVLGEDYNKVEPRAGRPIEAALPATAR